MDTYKATNTENGKFYIGSTKNFKERKNTHLGRNKNYPFQNALRKNPKVFEWEIWSDDCDEPVLEQALLDMFFGTEQCYNLNPKASIPPSRKGISDSDKTRKKKSNAKLGKKPWVNEVTEEICRSFECPGIGWKQGLSVNTKKKLSQVNLGEKHPQFGVPRTEAQKKATSEKLSKAIIAIKPDGTELHFGGVNKAARELGIAPSSLCGMYLKTGKSPTKGKFKGWRFIYENR